jgi:hypothetical protein
VQTQNSSGDNDVFSPPVPEIVRNSNRNASLANNYYRDNLQPSSYDSSEMMLPLDPKRTYLPGIYFSDILALSPNKINDSYDAVQFQFMNPFWPFSPSNLTKNSELRTKSVYHYFMREKFRALGKYKFSFCFANKNFITLCFAHHHCRQLLVRRFFGEQQFQRSPREIEC